MAARFLSREEWPLIAAGVAAGLLTSLLLLYIFFTGIGDEGIDPALVGDPVPITDPITDPITRPHRLPDGPGRGVIGRREVSVVARLDALPVAAQPLRGPLAITLRDVVWREVDGARFARAELITGRLDAQAAGRGDVILSSVVVRRPVVALRQARAQGPWNFEQVFAELLEPPDVAPARVRTIQLHDLQITDGTVDVTMPERRFTFQSVQGRLPLVVLSQPGVPEPYLRVTRATMEFVQTEPVSGRLVIDARDGLFAFPDGRVRFDVDAVMLDRTRLASVQGIWNPADPGFGITAEGLALALHIEDIAFLVPEAFPETGTASFTWQVRPLPGDRTEAVLTELDARTGQSRILGSLTVQVGDEFFALQAADLRLDPLELAVLEGFTGPLPYDGTLRGRLFGTQGDIGFELTARLTAATVPQPFSVDIGGRALMLADGVALQRADVTFTRLPLAAVRAFAPGLPVEGVITGRVTLTGPPTLAPLGLDVRLEIGAGVALVDGTLDLTGVVPTYDLTGRLIAIDLPALLAPDVPPVALTGTFAVRGAGFDPAEMDVAIRVAGRFTGWETAPGDTLHLVAELRQGTLLVRELQATLATAELAADGTWRFLEPQSGAVSYAVTVTSLRPFGPYLPLVGDTVAAGGVTAAGTLSGTLERLRLTGQLDASEVQVGEWQMLALTAQYDVTLGGDLLPRATVEGRARSLVTPTLGAFTTADLSLHLVPPEFRMELNALRPDGGLVEVAATGTVPDDGPRIIVVQRGRFDVDQGRWALVSPVTIRWLGQDVFVDGLTLEEASTEGRLHLDGRILPRDAIDARFQLAALPAGDLQAMFGQQRRLDGRLWAEGVVRGEAADPLITVDFRVEQGVFEGVPLERLDGRLIYRDQLTDVQATATADDLGYLNVQARLPSVVRLGGDPAFSLIDGVPLSGSLTASRFALAPFEAAAPARIQDVRGVIDAQVELTGTADAPVVAGTATLSAGAVTVTDLNQRYDDISGQVEFSGRRLVIVDLRARSDGWAVAGGQVVLERLDNPVLDLTLQFEGFRPIGVENQRDAALFGSLALDGPPAALQLAGRLHVDDGYIVVPQFGGPGAELIDITRPPPVMGRTLEGIQDGGALQNLTIRDLRVSFGDGAWFMVDEARAQLAGELIVNKIGNDTPITGTLAGTRGQYTLLAGPIVRRFDVVSAQVRFLGSPMPNPALDITARRVVFDPAGRPIEVDVRITGTMTTPRLAVAGGDAIGIAESELLSFLIFGRPTFALGGQYLIGDDILEQTLWGGLAEVLAIELERGLGGLGLDVFQIRLGAGPLGGLRTPTVVLGRQLRPDVFLTVETGVTALLGGSGAGAADASPLHWAVRLDWALSPRTRAGLALEPVYGGRAFRGAALALPLRDPKQQFLAELRRRWTY
jgi:hypothetical protein